VPLKNSKGEVVGAIGISGCSVENDHAVASAGAAARGSKLRNRAGMDRRVGGCFGLPRERGALPYPVDRMP
jgi:Haem degrading protein HbpS-like